MGTFRRLDEVMNTFTKEIYNTPEVEVIVVKMERNLLQTSPGGGETGDTGDGGESPRP